MTKKAFLFYLPLLSAIHTKFSESNFVGLTKTGSTGNHAGNSSVDTGCNNTKYKDGINLEVHPDVVDQFGGVYIRLQGPCTNWTWNLTCTFDDVKGRPITVPAKYLAINESECEVPQGLLGIGWNQVSLTANHDLHIDIFTGLLYVTDQVACTKQVLANHPFHIDSNGTITATEQTLYINWYADVLFSANVSIKVVKCGLQSAGMLKCLNSFVVTKSTQNVNWFTIPLLNATLADLSFVYAVKVESIEDSHNVIYSNLLLPSQLFSVPQDLAKAACNSWYNGDSGPPEIVISCPPTIQQAHLDPRYEQSSVDAQPIYAYVYDRLFKTSTPDFNGKGQRCVYSGIDLFLGHPYGGSVDTVSPYTANGSLGNYVADWLPWDNCCVTAGPPECRRYYQKRPSNGGSNYKPPHLARANGCGHIRTFDGVEYNFTKEGDFWMIKNATENNTLLIQGRMKLYDPLLIIQRIHMRPHNSTPFTTVFVCFAFWQPPNGDKLQVCVSDADQLEVKLNSVNISGPKDDFDPSAPSASTYCRGIEHFKGGKITRNIWSPSKVKISFLDGLEVVITAAQFALNIIVYLGEDKKGLIEGLLGYFDGNKTNDFKTPNGLIIPIDSEPNRIHTDFAEQWAVNKFESLFVDWMEPKQSPYVNYNSCPNSSYLSDPILQLCHATKGDGGYCQNTKAFEENFNQLVAQINNSQVVVCPAIPYDIHQSISATTFTVGGQIRFGCFDGYQLVGPSNIICGANGSWSNQPPKCVNNDTSSPTSTTQTSTTSTITTTTVNVIPFNVSTEPPNNTVCAGNNVDWADWIACNKGKLAELMDMIIQFFNLIKTLVSETVQKQPHVAIYRFLNGNDHFYTNNQDEYQALLKNPTAKFESIIGYMVLAPEASVTTPIYRLYAHSIGHHMYAGEAEKNALVATGSWNYEGLLGYCSDTQQNGMSELHRFYNTINYDHLFTADKNETDHTRRGKFPEWIYEGVVCHIYTEQ